MAANDNLPEFENPAVIEHGSFTASQSIETFFSSLQALLIAEPVEDGISHPAEELIRSTLQNQPDQALHWVSTFLAEAPNPSHVADALHCLGRMPFNTLQPIAQETIIRALDHPDAEVREAAVSCIEQWEEPALIEFLKNHQDPVPWLGAYSQQVILDLSPK